MLTTKQVKSLVRKQIKKWTPILGLKNWEIKVSYEDMDRIVDGMSFLAETVCTWYTLRATIAIFLPAIKKLDKEEIELTVVHELVHIVLDEMSECDSKHDERACETISKALLKKQ